MYYRWLEKIKEWWKKIFSRAKGQKPMQEAPDPDEGKSVAEVMREQLENEKKGIVFEETAPFEKDMSEQEKQELSALYKEEALAMASCAQKKEKSKDAGSIKPLEGEITEESFFSSKVRSTGMIIMGKFFRHKLALIGVVILSIIVLAALFAPVLTPYDPTKINLDLVPDGLPVGPSWQHIFGVDQLGRDYFTRALYGARVSITVGILSVIISFAIGLPLGMLAGFYGGVIDNVISRFIEFLMCLPLFFIILSIASASKDGGLFSVVVIIAAFGWMGCSRIIRGQILQVKNLEYAKAAKALGLSDVSIMFKHLLPNAVMPLIMTAISGVVSAIITETGLSFLGLGVQAPMPSWGSMLNDGRRFQLVAPFMMVIPGLLITFVVIALNFIGDGMRDAIDPKNS